jgi:hypothetical protein
VAGGRIEQRLRLRAEPPLSEAAVLVRGGPDTQDKLARHARRTARAWSLDGQPLLGISVFAVLDIPLDELLSARFATYRMIHMPTAARLRDRGFELLPTGVAPALHRSPPPGRQHRARRAAGRARAFDGQRSVR